MSKPAVEIKGLSKAYMIGHEQKAQTGTLTIRDNIVSALSKPKEFFTGHQLKKEKFWALKDVDLNIEQGDVVGIIGRNGSGKSTLLKVLSRIVEPTAGEAILRGRVASLLEVGTGFHPELTGRENVYFNGAILGMKRREIAAKFDEIVAFSEVEKFLDTPVKFYSSGMYVRLAFAVAAHLDPDILIVDEVLAVGDARFQKKSLGRMKEAAKDGRTVIFVSHNLESVSSLCNKGVYLRDGKVVDIGKTEDVISSYMRSVEGNLPDNDFSRRNGPGGLSLKKVWLTNVQNRVVTSITSGTPITINLNVKVDERYQKSSHIAVGIGIDDVRGRRITTLYTPWTGDEISAKGPNLKVQCKVPYLPFAAGTYMISVGLGIQSETLEYTEQCQHFEIAASKLYSGRTEEHGYIDLPAEFEAKHV
jgi:lipopolysaccharide transport system ATP-binding protein